MKKFLKQISANEPLIVWLRYFLTLNWKYFLTNFVLPIIFCVILGFLKHDYVEEIEIDLFTISSIFIGFAISVLVMLLTTENQTINELKATQLNNTKINLHQAMVYKFAFIIYNLVVLIIFSLILKVFDIHNIICNLICLFVIINALLTIIEATSNTLFTLLRKKTNK